MTRRQIPFPASIQSPGELYPGAPCVRRAVPGAPRGRSGALLMEPVRWLREPGLKVDDRIPESGADDGTDAFLVVAVGDRTMSFAVQAKSRAPYPHEMERLQRSRHELERRGHPLMIAPFISESLRTGDRQPFRAWTIRYPSRRERKRRLQGSGGTDRRPCPGVHESATGERSGQRGSLHHGSARPAASKPLTGVIGCQHG